MRTKRVASPLTPCPDGLPAGATCDDGLDNQNVPPKCATAECAAGLSPHKPDCRAACVADFANPIPDAFTEAGVERLGKAKFGEATGLVAKDLLKKFNKAKGAYDLASCLKQCKEEPSCKAE